MTHNQFVGHVVGTCILDSTRIRPAQCLYINLNPQELWDILPSCHWTVTSYFMITYNYMHVFMITSCPHLNCHSQPAQWTIKVFCNIQTIYTINIKQCGFTNSNAMPTSTQSTRSNKTRVTWAWRCVFSSFYSFSAIGFIWFVFWPLNCGSNHWLSPFSELRSAERERKQRLGQILSPVLFMLQHLTICFNW